MRGARLMAGVRAPRAWQRMLSGRRLDLIDPSPLDIEIADIAHGLARVARWNGQTQGPEIFSVAQHSLLVEALYRALAPQCAHAELLAALLHDAPEYVIGDIISPFKAVIGADYKRIERGLQAATHIRFGLPAQTPAGIAARIKSADRAAAYFEATSLAGFAVAEAHKLFGAPKIAPRAFGDYLRAMQPREAQDRFLRRFGELTDAKRSAAQ
jgi:5'-deoxynucleotidase YfbR-like HD superfamily hydrolase